MAHHHETKLFALAVAGLLALGLSPSCAELQSAGGNDGDADSDSDSDSDTDSDTDVDTDTDGDTDSDTDTDADTDSDADGGADTDTDADTDADTCPYECYTVSLCALTGVVADEYACADADDVCCEVGGVDTDTCPCTSGACCDGCGFLGSDSQCDATAVSTEYGCASTACGGDVQARSSFRFCSGASAACDDSNVQAEAWHVTTDCTDDQKCVSSEGAAWCADDPSCSGCTQGANVATSATPASSGGGTAVGYDVTEMNDGNLQASCTFHWVDTDDGPSGKFIQYTWSTAQTLWGFWLDTNYYTDDSCGANPRTLGQGTIQWWSGSAWVTDSSVSGATDDWSIAFAAPITTTSLRIYNIQVNPACPVQQDNPIIYEWRVYACE